jgi:hypothetical protein
MHKGATTEKKEMRQIRSPISDTINNFKNYKQADLKFLPLVELETEYSKEDLNVSLLRSVRMTFSSWIELVRIVHRREWSTGSVWIQRLTWPSFFLRLFLLFFRLLEEEISRLLESAVEAAGAIGTTTPNK